MKFASGFLSALSVGCVFNMEHFYRRNRILKTLLSLTLVFVTLLMIQKFKVLENNMKDSRIDVKTTWWCDSGQCKVSKRENLSAPVLHNAPVGWNISVLNCAENRDVRNQPWFKTLDSRFHQFVLHRHCRYFPMLINHPEKCSGDVDLLIVIKSINEQHDRREAVRRTWAKEHSINGKVVKTLFLLGTPAPGKDSKNLQKLLEYEDRLYGDVLQWDFMDTFFNLTLKEVNFLRWFNIYCSTVPFIFKGDDDVFMNPRNLLDLISFRTNEGKVDDLFVGDTISKASPIRNHQSKYYIPKELFEGRYPPYVGGGGFVMSSKLAQRLLVVSERIEVFPIDDVFLGMCLQNVGVTPEMHPGFKTFGIIKRKVSPMNSEPCFFRQLIVVHKLSPQELLKMWDTVHDEHLQCAKKKIV